VGNLVAGCVDDVIRVLAFLVEAAPHQQVVPEATLRGAQLQAPWWSECPVIQALAFCTDGKGQIAFADAGYVGIEKRDETGAVQWHVAMRPGRRRTLDKSKRLDRIYDEIERRKAGVRAKVEHPFRVLKCQFGCLKARYRGLAKNTAQIETQFALANLWMRARCCEAQGIAKPQRWPPGRDR
jgi:hypothetical protein